MVTSANELGSPVHYHQSLHGLASLLRVRAWPPKFESSWRMNSPFIPKGGAWGKA